MDLHQQTALDRLIRIAQADTGQNRKVADFLLSWGNAAICGGFDPTEAVHPEGALAIPKMPLRLGGHLR